MRDMGKGEEGKGGEGKGKGREAGYDQVVVKREGVDDDVEVVGEKKA